MSEFRLYGLLKMQRLIVNFGVLSTSNRKKIQDHDGDKFPQFGRSQKCMVCNKNVLHPICFTLFPSALMFECLIEKC